MKPHAKKHRPIDVLIVAYAFPPVGGAGVQRVSKLVKYLPQHGVRASVLTSRNPSVPLHDRTLGNDIPADLPITRARTFEPPYLLKEAAWVATADSSRRPSLRTRLARLAGAVGRNVLLPDAQVLWLPAAALALTRRLKTNPPDVVFITAPPFSQFLLAPLVRMVSRVAVVVDYRDEWDTYRTTYEMTSLAGDLAGKVLEGRVLRAAHVVTTATPAFRDALLRRFSWLDPAAVVDIPNGYDPDDFPHELPEPPGDKFVLTYGGTVFRHTTARNFIAGLRRFHEKYPELARQLSVRFIGRVVQTEKAIFEGTESLGVTRIDYLDHEDSLREIAKTHAVMCLLDEIGGTERAYPGKVFEIMNLGRPCLFIAPKGALSGLARRHRLGEVVAPKDVDGIAEALARMVRDFVAGRFTARSSAVDIERYHRKNLAGEFASAFRRAILHAHGVSPGDALRAARKSNEPDDRGDVEYHEGPRDLAGGAGNGAERRERVEEYLRGGDEQP